jgi:serine/threonine protein kinase
MHTHEATLKKISLNRFNAPLNRFLATQPFRCETGDGATIFTRGGTVYKLDGILGLGGLSVVYLATRYSDGMVVAFKVPNRKAKNTVDAVRLLKREARILSRFNHENIVRVIDQGETSNGEPFVAMDLVRAQTVDMLMVANGGKLPLVRAGNMILQVCDALGHAHDRGVIHRDIKPGNIMVRTTGGVDKIVLFDFGIASEDGDESEVADSGSILYSSPEQLFNRICQPSSDVYQVALLLFETLTGRLPFERDVFPAVLYRQGELPVLPEFIQSDYSFPPELLELLADSLSSEPAARPGSMHGFAHRLRRIITGLRRKTLSVTTEENKVPA